MTAAAGKIVLDILKTFYHAFGFSFVFAMIFMCLYLYAEENGDDFKKVIGKWKNAFCKDKRFRYLFYLSFYATMVLFRTLVNRNVWSNPLSAVNGGWKVFYEDGSIAIEPIENFMMLMPFSVLILMAFHEKVLKDESLMQYLFQGLKYSFLFSLGIECCQLIFRLGTFQFSDLILNTAGGVLGAFLYWCFRKIRV